MKNLRAVRIALMLTLFPAALAGASDIRSQDLGPWFLAERGVATLAVACEPARRSVGADDTVECSVTGAWGLTPPATIRLGVTPGVPQAMLAPSDGELLIHVWPYQDATNLRLSVASGFSIVPRLEWQEAMDYLGEAYAAPDGRGSGVKGPGYWAAMARWLPSENATIARFLSGDLRGRVGPDGSGPGELESWVDRLLVEDRTLIRSRLGLLVYTETRERPTRANQLALSRWLERDRASAGLLLAEYPDRRFANDEPMVELLERFAHDESDKETATMAQAVIRRLKQLEDQHEWKSADR